MLEKTTLKRIYWIPLQTINGVSSAQTPKEK